MDNNNPKTPPGAQDGGPNGALGPDPQVVEAQDRLAQTELTPLEECLFKAWANANQLKEGETEGKMDLRNLYKVTGGKVQPPGQLQRQADMVTATLGSIRPMPDLTPPETPEAQTFEPTDTERDPMQTLIALMKEKNKETSLAMPKPPKAG